MTIPLFDVQAGFGGLKTGSREVYSAEALLADMDRLKIERALVRITPEELDKDVAFSNRMLYDACEASGGRLAPCPVAVPSAGGDFPPEARQVEEAVARGAGAIVLRPGPDNWSIEEWSGGKLLAAMEERGLPALCLVRLVPLAEIAQLAQAHARLPIVVAETNYRTHRLLCGLLESFPNVLLSIGSNYTVHGGIEHLVARFGPRRVLFGTGTPRAEPMMAVTQLLYSGLSEDDKKTIGRENLIRLIGGIRK